MRKLIKMTPRYKVYHHTGVTKFTGCQCFKDCTCKEDFVEKSYSYFTVKKRFNKQKTTIHKTLEEVEARCQVLDSLEIKT